MKKNFNGFYVNFISKDFHVNNSKNFKIKGKAYYLYDDNDVIYKQFIQIEKANFRPTDKEMLVTKYYSRANINDIRKNILEEIQIKKGFDKNKISKNAKIRIDIDDEYILLINKWLLNQNKIKSSIDIFSGSNSSGAETNHKATNVITYYDELEYSGLNFSNPLNNKQLYRKRNVKIKSINEINLISFKDFLKKSNLAKKLIDRYNLTKINVINNVVDENNLNFLNDKNQFNIKKVLKIIKDDMDNNHISLNTTKYFIDKVNETINSYCYSSGFDLNDKTKVNNLIKKLRGYQKIGVDLEKFFLYETYANNIAYYSNFLKNSTNTMTEYCHIIPVHYSKKSIETLKEISDPNNCLLLTSDCHKYFDSKKIFFNNQGKCFRYESLEPIKTVELKEEFLNEERKKYIDKYYYLFVKR